MDKPLLDIYWKEKIRLQIIAKVTKAEKCM
jgi:hypothetical protein